MPRMSTYTASTANAVAVAAITSPGTAAVLKGVSALVSYSGANTTGALTITSTNPANSVTTTLYSQDLISAAATNARIQLDSLASYKGGDLTATLAAGGSGIIGKVTLIADAGKP